MMHGLIKIKKKIKLKNKGLKDSNSIIYIYIYPKHFWQKNITLSYMAKTCCMRLNSNQNKNYDTLLNK